uniref:Zinc finger, CCHC-type n=1 Tax=Tanacetum cinerariifolium TaxID=118510 RepID=A0A6L2MDF7_TANCI|nr:zinc finger, CCHC-type [Tanacetum cinerariifolium]
MLKTTEKNVSSKIVVSSLHMIREGGVNKKSWKKRKGMSKGWKKVPPPPKKESIAKDAECFHCRKIRHWKRNLPSYLAELKRGYRIYICNNVLGMRSNKRLEKGCHGAAYVKWELS